MRSGGLNRRILIQKRRTTADSIGYPVEEWVDVAEVWGELQEEKGTEVLRNDRPVSFRRAVLFLRYRADITAKNRVKIDGIAWEIETFRTLDGNRRKEGLELTIRTND